MFEKIKLFNASNEKHNLEGISDLFESGAVSTGNCVSDLEKKLCETYSRTNALCFSDMTSALVELLKHLGVGEGDCVLCHPFSCLSTTMAIKLVGASIHWLPINDAYLCIDISMLRNIPSNSKILLNYNIAGILPNYSQIENFCDVNNLIFINDCNNSELSTFKDIYSVKYGDYSILSFYPNRHFGGIDGAAILSDRDMGDLSLRKRFSVNYENYRYENGLFNEHHEIKYATGANNMSNISAKLVLNKIHNFDSYLNLLSEKSKKFDEEFFEISIKNNEYQKNNYWAFPLFVEDKHLFCLGLSKLNIETSELHYPNNKYEILGTEGYPLKTPNLMWIPLDYRCLDMKGEIISYAGR